MYMSCMYVCMYVCIVCMYVFIHRVETDGPVMMSERDQTKADIPGRWYTVILTTNCYLLMLLLCFSSEGECNTRTLT